MDAREVVLIVAALLCAVAGGLLFAFAAVVMPGLRKLDDREFIRSFQAIDRVVQDGQPIFGLVVGGSAIALFVGTGLNVGTLDGADRWLLIASAIGYALGGILPTVAVNLRLNNRLQTYDVDALDEETLHRVRRDFEPTWNLSNAVRTTFAMGTATLLVVVLARM